MKKNWDMSNWEEHIRAEILLGKARSPQPNWEKMAGMLDANADRNRRRRLWLFAACFGGLLLLGAGFLAAPQRDLIRQYAFKMRAAESGSPAPNLSPQGLSPQQSESGTVLEQGAPASHAFTPSFAAQIETPIMAVEPSFILTSPTITLSTTTLLVQPLPVRSYASFGDLPTPLSSPVGFPDEKPRMRWQIGIRGESLLSSNRSKTQNGQVTIEQGYGSQPGGWLEVACLMPKGVELGVALGGHAVWEPLEQQSTSDAEVFSDVWGKALGGFVQARKYIFPQGRVQPFVTAQAGYARQKLSLTEFTYEANSGEGNDPHNFWKFRKDLPESAIITSTAIRRNVVAASTGAGLQVNFTDQIGLFASSQAQMQWVVGGVNSSLVSSTQNLFWDHSLGLRWRF